MRGTKRGSSKRRAKFWRYPQYPSSLAGYQGNHFGDAVRAKGGTPRIVVTAMWGRDEAETLAKLEAWNQPIHRIRGRIEKIFGTWKRSYGLRRMRWRGLAKAAVQIRLTAIAYNMKRALKITAVAG
jgi:IS5 family transposase